MHQITDIIAELMWLENPNDSRSWYMHQLKTDLLITLELALAKQKIDLKLPNYIFINCFTRLSIIEIEIVARFILCMSYEKLPRNLTRTQATNFISQILRCHTALTLNVYYAASKLIDCYELNSVACRIFCIDISELLLLHISKLIYSGLDINFFNPKDLVVIYKRLFNLATSTTNVNPHSQICFRKTLEYIDRHYLDYIFASPILQFSQKKANIIDDAIITELEEYQTSLIAMKM